MGFGSPLTDCPHCGEAICGIPDQPDLERYKDGWRFSCPYCKNKIIEPRVGAFRKGKVSHGKVRNARKASQGR